MPDVSSRGTVDREASARVRMGGSSVSPHPLVIFVPQIRFSSVSPNYPSSQVQSSQSTIRDQLSSEQPILESSCLTPASLNFSTCAGPAFLNLIQLLKLHCKLFRGPSQVSNFVDSRALERRAEAVDDASVVLCCLSNDFIDNKFCELEVQYAYRLKKKMVFMQMQENYKPKGWIGMVIGVGEIINMHDNFLRGFNLSKLVRFIDACEQDMIL